MKKRVLSITTALVLTLCTSIAAYASSEPNSGKIETVGGTASHGVFALYQSNTDTEADKVYSVEVAWGSMAFTYSEGTLKWNPESHEYTNLNAGWKHKGEGANEVTVINHSNAELRATVSAVMDEGYTGINPSVENGNIILGDASKDADTQIEGFPTSGKASISLSGELQDNTAPNQVIGTVTVTITDVAEGGNN